jgi:hypothetical protein
MSDGLCQLKEEEKERGKESMQRHDLKKYKNRS